MGYDHCYLDSELIVGGGGVGCQIEGVFAIAQLSPWPTGEASLKSDWLDDAAEQHDSTHNQAEPCPGGWRNHICEHRHLVWSSFEFQLLIFFGMTFHSKPVVLLNSKNPHLTLACRFDGKGGGQEEKNYHAIQPIRNGLCAAAIESHSAGHCTGDVVCSVYTTHTHHISRHIPIDRENRLVFYSYLLDVTSILIINLLNNQLSVIR